MSQTPPDREPSEPDEHDEQVDQQLAGRLRRADPAAGLAPLGEDALQAMLRATTGTPRTGTSETVEIIEAPAGITTEAPAAATEARSAQVGSLSRARRRRRRWTGAAGLGLAAAAAGVIAIGGGLPGAAGGGPEVTALRAAPPSSDGLAVACAPVDASFLAGRDLAFQGTVTGVRPVQGGEVVVLDVERVYRGDVGQRVEVSTPGAGTTVDGTVELVAGQDYLVAASEGTVSGCGATGLVSPELEALYGQAFGGGS